MTQKHIAIAIAATAVFFIGAASAQTPPQPGASFSTVFTGLCMRRIGNLEALRNELKAKGFPVLQEPAASAFLEGHPGDAWAVPESGAMGNLVLTLPSDHYQCSVLARRGSIAQVEAEFVQLMTSPPVPMSSELKTDERSSTTANGEIHSMGYQWKTATAPNAIAFFLTTAASPNAAIQLKATATRVSVP